MMDRDKVKNIWEAHFLKITIGAVALVILFTGIVMVFTIINSEKERDPEQAMINEKLDDAGITKDQQEGMSHLEQEYYEHDENLEEMGEAHISSEHASVGEYGATDEALEHIIDLYGEFDYEGVVDYVSDILGGNNLTEGENVEIAALFNDASDMLRYDYLSNSTKEEILKTHEHPISLAIDTLHAYPKRRNAVVLDMSSVSPYYEGGYAKVISYNEIESNSEEYKIYERYVVKNEIKKMYKIELELPSTNITCVIIKNSLDIYRVVGFYGEEAAQKYISQSEWNALGRDADSPKQY